jgi:hypothetical protein
MPSGGPGIEDELADGDDGWHAGDGTWRRAPEARAVGLGGQSAVKGARHDEPPSILDRRSCAPLAQIRTRIESL